MSFQGCGDPQSLKTLAGPGGLGFAPGVFCCPGCGEAAESSLFPLCFHFAEVQAVLLTDILVFLQEKDQKYVFASLVSDTAMIRPGVLRRGGLDGYGLEALAGWRACERVRPITALPLLLSKCLILHCTKATLQCCVVCSGRLSAPCRTRSPQ